MQRRDTRGEDGGRSELVSGLAGFAEFHCSACRRRCWPDQVAISRPNRRLPVSARRNPKSRSGKYGTRRRSLVVNTVHVSGVVGIAPHRRPATRPPHSRCPWRDGPEPRCAWSAPVLASRRPGARERQRGSFTLHARRRARRRYKAAAHISEFLTASIHTLYSPVVPFPRDVLGMR